jgi:clan AA aspartic protease (TIGR02281 family)
MTNLQETAVPLRLVLAALALLVARAAPAAAQAPTQYYCAPLRATSADVATCPVPWLPPAHSQGSEAFLNGESDWRELWAWFATQAGDHRTGADWWAANRSLVGHPSCKDVAAGRQGFVAGCQGAKARLDAIDDRRHTNPEYRAGFNAGAKDAPLDRATSSGGPFPIPTEATPPAANVAVAGAVQIEREHGIFMVPVRVNDAVTIPFVLDSGAADVSVPEDVFKTLLRTRTVAESDLLSPGTYINADGGERLKRRFKLHELRVGSFVIKDIEASVAPDVADPLLGQSFLEKLPGWAIDNTKHTLVIGNGDRPETTLPAAPAVPSKSVLAADLQKAERALGTFLGKDGGGLVTTRSACPGGESSDDINIGWEVVRATEVAPIEGVGNAILIDTSQCGGGNKHGQYLVITRDGSANVITNAEIDDMSFIGRSIRAEGTSLFLPGVRWRPHVDPHCCPFAEATLQYDVKTGKHRFILGRRFAY